MSWLVEGVIKAILDWIKDLIESLASTWRQETKEKEDAERITKEKLEEFEKAKSEEDIREGGKDLLGR